MVNMAIDKIPDETLCEIFLHCLPTHLWEVSMSPKQAPVLLTHVCRQWKEIATVFPPLWTRISLSFKEGEEYSNSQLSRFDEWLSRSKSTALNLQIEIKSRYIYERVSAQLNLRLDHILIPITRSLTQLTLNRVPAYQLQALPSGLFVSLESLVVRPVTDAPRHWLFQTTEPIGIVEAFREAPSLRRVALTTGEQGTNIALPLEQLTHCVLGSDEWGDRHRLFLVHQLFRLVELRFLYIQYRPGCAPRGVPPSWNSPIRMEKVEALILIYPSDGVSYPDLLDMYDFPNLASLQIEGMEFDIFSKTALTSVTWEPPHVERFLSKLEKFDRLEHLCLAVGLGISTPTFHALFRALPDLTTLEFWMDCKGYDHGFRLLTFGQDPAAHLLVQLRTFIVGFHVATPLNAHVFHDFLKSRVQCSAERRLQNLVVCAPSRGFRYLSVVIQESRRHGLNVEEIRIEGTGVPRRDSWIMRDRRLRDWTEVRAVMTDDDLY